MGAADVTLPEVEDGDPHGRVHTSHRERFVYGSSSLPARSRRGEDGAAERFDVGDERGFVVGVVNYGR